MQQTILKRVFVKVGVMLASIFLTLMLSAFIIKQGNFDIQEGTRYSAIAAMLIIFCFLYSSLIAKRVSDRKDFFLHVWFVSAAAYNFVWQIPLSLFRHHFRAVDVSYNNLFTHIPWWGYGFADAHYRNVDIWMMSEEAWWFLAIIISLVGLYYIARGRRPVGYLLAGLGGALQAYNASLYIVYDIFAGLSTITAGSFTSQILYWGFNLLWPLTATIASLFCFQKLLASRA